jgi:fimbrial chaperone protein
VEPISQTFNLAQRNTQNVFKIINSANKPTAVQVRITTRKQNLDGSEQRQDADDQFLIYPPQLIIPPQVTQKVKVQWLGELDLKQEQAYRLIVEQVPVKLSKEEKTGVKLILTIEGTIYVVNSDNWHSDIQVEKVQAEKTKEGNKLALTLSNRGKAHSILHKLEVIVTQNGKSLTLRDEQVKGVEGMNVLSGATRKFLLPWPKELQTSGKIEAKIKFKEKQ